MQIDDAEFECKTAIGDRIPMLRSGLRQVLISNVTLGDVSVPFLSRWMMWAWMLSGSLLVMGVNYLESKHKASSRSIFWSTIPLFLGLFVMQWDAKVLIEDLRASWVSPYWLLPLLTTIPVLALKLLTMTWRELDRNQLTNRPLIIGIAVLGIANAVFYSQGWIGMLACLGVQGITWGLCRFWNQLERAYVPILWGHSCGLIMMGINAFHWAGTLWATIGGVSLGLLLIANKFVIPRFNLWSLLFISLLLTSTEVGLRDKSRTTMVKQWFKYRTQRNLWVGPSSQRVFCLV